MAELNRVEVEILGQKYTIRSASDAGYVRELAAYLEKRVLELRGAGGGQDATRLLALAALYITDELFRLRDERREADRAASARVGALRDLLDAVVTDR
jgi:cell division protein ZapA (FtsZ GTPase activity inhibitor)